MKIYEFENHLDNGITTFEFEITKKVDYFFNKKEIEDLIKRIEPDFPEIRQDKYERISCQKERYEV